MLFVIFSIKLLDKYKAIINSFHIMILYTINKKIKILVDKEDSIKARTIIEGALTARNFQNCSRS